MQTDKRDGSTVAILEDGEMITDTQTALDFIAEARHFHDSGKMAIPMECLPDTFFDLKSGVAGDMLQKFVNYGCKVAIYGDHSNHKSKPLNDFIRESNKGGHVLFPSTKEDALNALHGTEAKIDEDV